MKIRQVKNWMAEAGQRNWTSVRMWGHRGVTCIVDRVSPLVVAMGLTALVSAGAVAQRGATPPPNQLPPAAMEKLRVIERIEGLPNVDWRVHTGDLPHAEDPSLDISSWPAISSKSRAEKSLGPGIVWMRRTIEIPRLVNGYDLTGARIWFQIHTNARGTMTSIVYVNGKRVAEGEDLEPIILTHSARAGEKMVVAVEMLETRLTKLFSGVELRIDPVDPNRPKPEDILEQALAASEMLPYLPKPRPDLLPRVAEAIDAIDDEALKREDNAAFDASLRKAQRILNTLHGPLSTVSVAMVGNSHIDAAWRWPKTETVGIVHHTFDTAIQLMREYPEYKYTQSAAQYSEWVADNWPDLNKEIAQRVKEGRWELVGGMWVEPDLNLPGGESIVRQLLLGQRTFKKLYGTVATIGWNPDTFGYNWQMPQIYKRSGINYFVTQKMGWNDTNQLPLRLFWWQGLDGTRILTYFPTAYAHHNESPARIGNDFALSAMHNPGTFEEGDLYGIGDHGGGPTRMILDQAAHWENAQKTSLDAVPVMQFSTFGEFFSSVEGHLNPHAPVWNYEKLAAGWTAPPAGPNNEVGVPVWNDELYLEKHRGVYTTQAKHKWNMRHSEDETIDAEKFAAVAWLHGITYPGPQLTDNWKSITFGQFHDLAAGSGIEQIYVDAQKEYDAVFASDRAINEKSHGDIAARVNTLDVRSPHSVPVLVWNTMSWPRSGVVEFPVQLAAANSDALTIVDGAGRSLPYEAVHADGGTKLRVLVDGVPAVGYKLLHVRLEPGKAATQLESSDKGDSFMLENGKLSVTVRKADGCVTSVKRGQTEFLAANACANRLQAIADKPKNFDAWDIDVGTYDVPPTNIDEVDSISLITDGPLRKTVRVTRSWDKSKFSEDISLDADAACVSFDNVVDWQETHILLKAAFPLAVSGPKAAYEIPFGAIEREATRDNAFTKARFEVPAQRWADVGDGKQGVSLLNDSKYGYDTLRNTLRLTLLRSAVDPDPIADKGEQHMRYALYPHQGTWQSAQTVRHAYDFDISLKGEQVFSHAGLLPAEMSFVSIDAANVVLSAMKKAEDKNDLVFRVYETAGVPAIAHLHISPGGISATETNLMETPAGGRIEIKNDSLTLTLKPFEIRTVEVAYPVAKQ